jgi:hypothetical protein
MEGIGRNDIDMIAEIGIEVVIEVVAEAERRVGVVRVAGIKVEIMIIIEAEIELETGTEARTRTEIEVNEGRGGGRDLHQPRSNLTPLCPPPR